MSLPPGTRIGHYEVTSILGTGGMGEVYRARDARLERSVALKVLPPEVAGDADRLLRFKREAHVLASLNHPNIAAIYGLEEGRAPGSDAPIDALVLELVEGPTLAERIASGALPLDEARDIGMQMASALETAHERGIVHRDLKPANVKIRPDGTVKVLDFGLAKAWEPSSADRADVAASPTFTSPAVTRAGVILGTAAYMSPEQARGAPVDKRTDIWAFGCVLFEMLAGRHVFGATDTVSDAIAAVLKSEPNWEALPPDTPPQIRSLLKRCLEKDPKRRLRDVGDAGLLLSEPPLNGDAPVGISRRRITWVTAGGWALAAALAIANALLFARGSKAPTPAPAAPLRLELPLASQPLEGGLARTFDISSDGQRVIYLGRDSSGSSLHLQDLASGEIKRLPETDDADTVLFSPDGRAVGFHAGSHLKVLPLDGGLLRDVVRWEATFVGWAWSGPDHIVIAGQAGLTRVPLNGGSAEVIVQRPEGEALFGSAFALPGGAYVISMHATTTQDASSRVAVVIPGEAKPLLVAERGGSPRYIAGHGPDVGHIVYAFGGRLFARPFDATRRVLLGTAVPVVENVAMRPNGMWADYAVSSDGALMFREGSPRELVWVDRATGAARPLSANLRRFALPRLSPDGTKLAVEMQDSPHQVWMLEIERDVLVPLTSHADGSHDFAWAPTGSAMLYSLTDAAPPKIGWLRPDGTGKADSIPFPLPGFVVVSDWARDGLIAMTVMQPQKTMAVMTTRLEGEAPPRITGTPTKIADGAAGGISPDGAWITYCDCGVSGDRPSNVFVQHLESGAKYQVSTDEGVQPVWAPSGRELFFRAGSKMMAADLVISGASAKVGRPRMLFEGDYLDWGTPNYDVSADGKQFVMVRTAKVNTRTLSVRLNWKTELERLAPIKP